MRVCNLAARAAARSEPEHPGAEGLDTASAPATSVLWGHSGPVYGADLSDDGRCMFTASYDGTVRLWSTELWANLVAYRCAGPSAVASLLCGVTLLVSSVRLPCSFMLPRLGQGA